MPTYTLPYARQERYAPNGRLVDLIRAQGEDAARIAEIRGQQSAQMWGGIGNAIQQGVGNVMDALDPRRQAEAMQVEDYKKLRAGEAQVDTLMQGDQLTPGQEGPRKPTYVDANGLFDIPGLTSELSKGGMAHLAPELLKGAENINDSIMKHQALEQESVALKTVMFGDMADGALKLAKLGMPVVDAMDFVVQPGIATKRIAPQEYAQLRSQVMRLPPDQQIAALTTFMDAAAKLDKGETLADKAQRIDRYGRMVAENIGEPPAPSKALFAAILGDPNATPEQKAAAQKALDAMNPPAPAPTSFDAAILAAQQRGDTAEVERLLKLKAREAAATRAPEKLGFTMWATPPGGGDPRLMTPEEIRASGAIQPPTAEMRNKVAGRALAAKSINAVQDLCLKIITKVGPAQRADAIKRGAEAVFGSDPEFRTYQDSRMALAGNLAVAQQGSRPSDADIKAIWLPLVPDPYRDTAESAAMKWEMIRTMSSAPPSEGGAFGIVSGGGAAPPTATGGVEEWVRDSSGKLVKKAVK